MADPIIERILQAVQGRLEAITVITGLVVDRNRRDVVDDERALILQDGDQVHDEEQTIFVQNFRTIGVEGFVKTNSKAEIGPAINALWAEAVKTLTADANITLGGLAIEISLGAYTSNMVLEDDQRWSGEFRQEFTIHYATKRGDPYSLAP
jgi:hypothetical protein